MLLNFNYCVLDGPKSPQIYYLDLITIATIILINNKVI